MAVDTGAREMSNDMIEQQGLYLSLFVRDMRDCSPTDHRVHSVAVGSFIRRMNGWDG